jgi:hypothetical protein
MLSTDPPGSLPPTGACGGFGGAPCTGVPFSDLDSDGDSVGMGDFTFRVFYKGFAKTDSPMRDGGELEFFAGIETTVPSATDDVLGSKSWILSPMATVVMDMPANGIAATLNFFDFDVWHDRSRSYTERYRGRWFYMQPLTPPDMGALGGLYLMPEFQPIYDFRADNFSFWVGPEVGKVLAPGRVVYVKPGFGVDPRRAEREISFETGFRWFF